MARTELVEVKRMSWGKGPKKLYLYEAVLDGQDPKKPVLVTSESPQPSCLLGRFESFDAFIHFLNFHFGHDEIEIVSRIAFEGGTTTVLA